MVCMSLYNAVSLSLALCFACIYQCNVCNNAKKTKEVCVAPATHFTFEIYLYHTPMSPPPSNLTLLEPHWHPHSYCLLTIITITIHFIARSLATFSLLVPSICLSIGRMYPPLLFFPLYSERAHNV